jgi:hypothetical protein
MTRCNEFYSKFTKEGNFCKKYPGTVKRIEKYIDLMEELETEATRSEILCDSSEPIGSVLSEGASRPLYNLNDADRNKAIKLIIKKAEQKVIDNDERIAVTSKEVNEIVRTIVPPKKSLTPPKDPVKTRIENAFKDVSDDAIDATIAQIDELSTVLTDTRRGLVERKAGLSGGSSYGQQEAQA